MARDGIATQATYFGSRPTLAPPSVAVPVRAFYSGCAGVAVLIVGCSGGCTCAVARVVGVVLLVVLVDR